MAAQVERPVQLQEASSQNRAIIKGQRPQSLIRHLYSIASLPTTDAQNHTAFRIACSTLSCLKQSLNNAAPRTIISAANGVADAI